jgi:deferrochelatase/peroxidase EfeB
VESGFTRRRLLEAAGAGVALAGLPPAAFGTAAKLRHQAGIATPEQPRLLFAALDASAANRKELRDLMREWTLTARRLSTHGRTITLGFGPSLFGRYGLPRPHALKPLPAFAGDELDPAKSGGDLAIQICGDDVELLERFPGAKLRWAVRGHHRKNRRNNMGFKEGANNIAPDDPVAMSHDVWVGAKDRPAWMRGGSYLVARRIRIDMQAWNATPVHRQERIIGRHKQSSAPLGGKHEHDQVDFERGVTRGDPVIPNDAHIRLASPHANGGTMLLRRSYNIDEGLLFLAFQRHPRQFIAIQRRLGQSDDAMSRFIVHEGSALFACPPAARKNGFVGEGLL